MSKYSDLMQEFLDENTVDMSKNLAEALLSQYGGEDKFLSNCRYVNEGHINGGIHGFVATHELVDFFANNKDEIMIFAQKMVKKSRFDSVEKILANLSFLSGGYNEIEVAAALQDPESDDYSVVVNAFVWFLAEQFASLYINFTNSDLMKERRNDIEQLVTTGVWYNR